MSKEYDPRHYTMLYGSRIGLPEVSELRKAQFNYSRSPVDKEVLQDQFKILFLARGWQTALVNQKRFRIGAGQILIIPPFATTSSGGEPKEKNLIYTLHVKHPRCKKNGEYLGMSMKETRAFSTLLKASSKKIIEAGIDLQSYLEPIYEYAKNHETPFYPFILKTLWNDFIRELIHILQSQKENNAKKTMSSEITMILNYIRSSFSTWHPSDNPPPALSVKQLAALTQLSISRFKGKFRTEVGIPPGDYLSRIKIQYAKKFLQKAAQKGIEKPVTRTALEFEYSSVQYFSTQFKKYTAYTPSEWLDVFS